MLFRNVTDQALHEFQNGNGFGNQLIIFMPETIGADHYKSLASEYMRLLALCVEKAVNARDLKGLIEKLPAGMILRVDID